MMTSARVDEISVTHVVSLIILVRFTVVHKFKRAVASSGELGFSKSQFKGTNDKYIFAEY